MDNSTKPLEDLAPLERRLGHLFARPALLLEALCHRSYVYEQTGTRLRENERLEFLGDAVLELAVTSLLFRRFPWADEGRLTRFRATLVNEQGLSRVAREIGLGRFLLLGRGEAASGGADKPSILADALEALLGAVCLDAGFEAAARLIETLWKPLISQTAADLVLKDYKTRLQEFLQDKERLTPTYRVTKSQGPDHERTFFVEVSLKGQLLGSGQGRSKKEAQQAAAQAALAGLGLSPEEEQGED
ncbi:MAG: ribonuclease III [Deltaproteobacteria bacterium]|nr:ribonuclease III [Deltaproteobacteria bacterium]